MRRRQFIVTLVAAALPSIGATAQSSTPVIGFLSGQAPEDNDPHMAAFVSGLREAGYVDGQNARIESRWARNQPGRLAGLAAALVEPQPAVLVAVGGDAAAR